MFAVFALAPRSLSRAAVDAVLRPSYNIGFNSHALSVLYSISTYKMASIPGTVSHYLLALVPPEC